MDTTAKMARFQIKQSAHIGNPTLAKYVIQLIHLLKVQKRQEARPQKKKQITIIIKLDFNISFHVVCCVIPTR